MPLRCWAPRSSRSKRLPRSFRVLFGDNDGIRFGDSRRCAVRFGVSPTMRRLCLSRSDQIAKTGISRASSAFIRPDTSGKIGSSDRRGRVLRANISLVVIGFAASISTAAAQYLPPQPPSVDYPPPGYYPYQGYRPPAYYGDPGLPTTRVLSGQYLSALSGHGTGRRRASVRR